MPKHPTADDTEATIGAIAYIPGLAPLIWLGLDPTQRTYFVRYHLGHAVLLNLTGLLALALTAALGFIPGAPGWLYLLMGLLITVVLLGAVIAHGLAALQAYRKRLIVLPLLTRLYYRISGGR